MNLGTAKIKCQNFLLTFSLKGSVYLLGCYLCQQEASHPLTAVVNYGMHLFPLSMHTICPHLLLGMYPTRTNIYIRTFSRVNNIN
jgi:hypothetical protein